MIRFPMELILSNFCFLFIGKLWVKSNRLVIPSNSLLEVVYVCLYTKPWHSENTSAIYILLLWIPSSYGIIRGFPGSSEVKVSACNVGDPGSIPGSGRSPGEGNGNPLQYSCLENPMDRGTWWATVHGVAESRARLSDFTFTMGSLIFFFSVLTAKLLGHCPWDTTACLWETCLIDPLRPLCLLFPKFVP